MTVLYMSSLGKLNSKNMLLYCSKCNNLVGKVFDETHAQGSTIEKNCVKCGTVSRFYVQYRAIIDKKWDKLPSSAKFASVKSQ